MHARWLHSCSSLSEFAQLPDLKSWVSVAESSYETCVPYLGPCKCSVSRMLMPMPVSCVGRRRRTLPCRWHVLGRQMQIILRTHDDLPSCNGFLLSTHLQHQVGFPHLLAGPVPVVNALEHLLRLIEGAICKHSLDPVHSLGGGDQSREGGFQRMVV